MIKKIEIPQNYQDNIKFLLAIRKKRWKNTQPIDDFIKANPDLFQATKNTPEEIRALLKNSRQIATPTTSRAKIEKKSKPLKDRKIESNPSWACRHTLGRIASAIALPFQLLAEAFILTKIFGKVILSTITFNQLGRIGFKSLTFKGVGKDLENLKQGAVQIAKTAFAIFAGAEKNAKYTDGDSFFKATYKATLEKTKLLIWDHLIKGVHHRFNSAKSIPSPLENKNPDLPQTQSAPIFSAESPFRYIESDWGLNQKD